MPLLADNFYYSTAFTMIQLAANSAVPSSPLGVQLSLIAKICLAASVLALLSLGTMVTVIGIKSSAIAQEATMSLARTSARMAYTLVEAVVCAVLTAAILVTVIYRLMTP